MINIKVGYHLASKFKSLRDRSVNRTTDTEFMIDLLNLYFKTIEKQEQIKLPKQKKVKK